MDRQIEASIKASELVLLVSFVAKFYSFCLGYLVVDKIRDKNDEDWLVVELKKGRSGDETVGQLLRYMGWVKENKSQNDERVFGVIIAGFPPAQGLLTSVSTCTNVDYYSYCRNKNGEVKFFDYQKTKDYIEWERLPFEQALDQIKRLIEEIRKPKDTSDEL